MGFTSRIGALTPSDKRVVEAFLDHRVLSGKILDTDGKSLHKMWLGGEKVAVWRGSKIAVVSTESSRTDQAILRYLVKLAGASMVAFSYERGKEHPLSIRFETGGDANGDQWDGWILAFVPGEKKPVGTLYWTLWRGEHSIRMVEVHPDYQRSGIATELYKRLFRDQGITKRDLQPGYQTDAGSKFRRSLLASTSRTGCIIATGTFGGDRCLLKNRDRNYEPEIRIYHEVRNGIEVLYAKDEITGWIEGINANGIAVVNSALQVGRDEAEKKLVKTLGKKSKDGERILRVLEQDNLDDALDRACKYKGGIKGHTFLASPDKTVSLEQTSKHECIVKTLGSGKIHVRTNHGFSHEDAGYSEDTEDYASSVARRDQARKILRTVDKPEGIAPAIYGKRRKELSDPLNMVRDTDNMRTTSQLVLNVTKLRMLFYVIPGKVTYLGYKNDLPKDHKPKLSLEVFEYTDIDDDGTFDVAKKIQKKTSSQRVAERWLAARKDKFPGGRADNCQPSDFDQEQLAKGVKVEREHTNDPDMAKEIAMDHLCEYPDYYTKLQKMEREGATDPFVGLSPGLQESLRLLAENLTWWMGNVNLFHLNAVGKLWRKDKELRQWLATHVNLSSYRLYYGRKLKTPQDALQLGDTYPRKGSVLQWSTNIKTAKWFAGLGLGGANWAGGALVEATASRGQVVVDIDRFSAVCGRHHASFAALMTRSDPVEMFSGEQYEGEVLTTAAVQGVVTDVDVWGNRAASSKVATAALGDKYTTQLQALRDKIAYNKARGLENTTELWLAWRNFYLAAQNWSEYVLDSLALPPKMAKPVEMVVRLLSKNYGLGKAPKNIIQWFESNEARFVLLDKARTWPERSEDSGIFVQGPFTVHNTVQASGKALADAMTAVDKAVKAASHTDISGLAQMASGSLYLVGQVARKSWAAWYMPDKDVIYLRPAIRGMSPVDVARHLVHEMGHRYWRKKLSSTTKAAWVEHHQNMLTTKPGMRVPIEGEKLDFVVNGKAVQVGSIERSMVTLVEQGSGAPVGSVVITKVMDWIRDADHRGGFPSIYAASDAEEHFCESLSFYAFGTLKGDNLRAFEEIVVGKGGSSAHRVASRWLRTAGYWGVMPWEGDPPLDLTMNVVETLDKTPAVRALYEALTRCQSSNGSIDLGQLWAWLGSLYATSETLYGLPRGLVETALRVVRMFPQIPGYGTYASTWRSPPAFEEALTNLSKNLASSLKNSELDNISLYKFKSQSKQVSDVEMIPKDDVKKSSKKVASRWVQAEKAKFKKKKEVPKAEGKGTTTVYEYSDKQIQHRNREKAKRVEKLRGSIDKIRSQVKKDLKSKDTATRLTALAVGLIDHTYERVGNPESAKEGHFGVTGWRPSHVTFSGSTATIKYVGKSGVDHEKKVTDAALVTALKEAVKDKSKDQGLFECDDCTIDASSVNAYLRDFDITAKDIRGLHANQEVQDRLKAIRSKGGKLPEDKKERDAKLKKEFSQAVDEAAKAVGHEPSTLRSQYLVPGMEEDFLDDGTVNQSLKKTSSVLLDGALDELWPGLSAWVFHQDPTGKRDAFEAFKALSAGEQRAVTTAVRSAFVTAHGGDTATLYRRMKPGQSPGRLGGRSLSLRNEMMGEVHAFEVRASDVFMHPGVPNTPLSSKAFGHEKEVILNPDANPKYLGVVYTQGKTASINPEGLEVVRVLNPGRDLALRLARLYLATKTQEEKEEEHIRKQVKPEPEYKPPRGDLRRRRITVDDPDLNDAGGAEKDPDLSLNYKKPSKKHAAEERLAALWLQAVEGDAPKKRKKGTVWSTPEGWKAKNLNGDVQVFKGKGADAKARAKAWANGREAPGPEDAPTSAPDAEQPDAKPREAPTSDVAPSPGQAPDPTTPPAESPPPVPVDPNVEPPPEPGADAAPDKAKKDKAKKDQAKKDKDKADSIEKQRGLVVGGTPISDEPKTDAQLSTRSAEAYDTFEDYDAKGRATAARNLAAALNDPELEPDSPREKEIQAILDGLQLKMIAEGERFPYADVGRTALPKSFELLVKNRAEHGTAEVMALLMGEEDFYGPKGRAVLTKAMSDMNDVDLATFLSGEGKGKDAKSTNPFAALIEVLNETTQGPTREPDKDYSKEELDALGLKERKAAMARQWINNIVVNDMTLVQAIQGAHSEGGSLEKDEEFSREASPTKALSAKLAAFLKCIKEGKDPGDCRKMADELARKHIEKALTVAEQVYGEQPVGNPQVEKAKRYVEKGDAAELDAKWIADEG